MIKQIKYNYCLDENGELIHINSLTPVAKRIHKYFCLQCGQEMIANLGEYRAWYFSHKKNSACDGESYLHKLAKRKIREKFMVEDRFPIVFSKDIPCSDRKSCPFFSEIECISHNIQSFSDLKKWNNDVIYDSCQEEVTYGGFRADLLLTNSKKPNRQPVFIEVFKTHKSDVLKTSSKYRIIETKQIQTEDDIENILKEGFVEGKNCTTHNFNPPVNEIRKKDVPIDRFVLFRNGSAYIYRSTDYVVFCDKVNQRFKPNSIIEFNLKNHGIDIFGLDEDAKQLNSYQTCLVYLVKKGMVIRNCILCKFYKYNDAYNNFICILYKNLGLNHPHPQQFFANKCGQYKINQDLIKHPLSELEKGIIELQMEQ